MKHQIIFPEFRVPRPLWPPMHLTQSKIGSERLRDLVTVKLNVFQVLLLLWKVLLTSLGGMEPLRALKAECRRREARYGSSSTTASVLDRSAQGRMTSE